MTVSAAPAVKKPVPGRAGGRRTTDDIARAAGHTDPPPRTGFFTAASVRIGCKACEVASK